MVPRHLQFKGRAENVSCVLAGVNAIVGQSVFVCYGVSACCCEVFSYILYITREKHKLGDEYIQVDGGYQFGERS